MVSSLTELQREVLERLAAPGRMRNYVERCPDNNHHWRCDLTGWYVGGRVITDLHTKGYLFENCITAAGVRAAGYGAGLDAVKKLLGQADD